MRKRESKYSVLLEDKKVEKWFRNLARGSQITANVALRRISRSSELLELNPKEMVEKARKDLAGF